MAKLIGTGAPAREAETWPAPIHSTAGRRSSSARLPRCRVPGARGRVPGAGSPWPGAGCREPVAGCRVPGAGGPDAGGRVPVARMPVAGVYRGGTG